MMKILFQVMFIILFVTVFVPVSYAFQAEPSISYTFPSYLIFLIPIIIIEIKVIGKFLGMNFQALVKIVVIANVISTIVVLPLTAYLHANVIYYPLENLYASYGIGKIYMENEIGSYIYRLSVGSVFLPDVASIINLPKWLIVSSTAMSLVPFFPVCWLVEYKILQMAIDDFSKKQVCIAVLKANVISCWLPILTAVIWVYLTV